VRNDNRRAENTWESGLMSYDPAFLSQKLVAGPQPNGRSEDD
jgi:hypothetical protein